MVQPEETKDQGQWGGLAEPFSRIFIDRAEADWAFDLLRETARRLQVTSPYDQRLAVTVTERSGKLHLHLNFGGWLVLGFRGPGLVTERVEMALLASAVAWDERLSFSPFERKEGEPEVRGYELPLEMVRPLTSQLQRAYETTVDFIAEKFRAWKKATQWKLHNPELVEAFFDLEKRAHLFAAGLAEPELRYERHFTAFHELAEEEGAYEVDGEMGRLEIEKVETRHKASLAEPFLRIFASREEAEWFFDFLKETLDRLGAKNIDDERFAITIRHHKRTLRLNFGSWLVTQFSSINSIYKVGIALISERIESEGNYIPWKPFANSEPAIRIFNFPIELVHPMRDELYQTYKETMTLIGQRFHHWRASHVRYAHQTQIAEAVFDVEKRKTVLDNGLSDIDIIALDEDEIEELNIEETNLPISQPPGFTQDKPSNLPTFQSSNLPIPLSQLAADTNIDELTLTRWLRAIERKKQVILYGPPGTGKTYLAERLARYLVGGSDGFVELVQFHPAYAYEDFIQGLRPEAGPEGSLTYKLVPGRFLEFCRKAGGRQGTCVLIIDEINRANLARVFGELMYLLEYREQAVPLAGGGEPFHIPDNVRLIGTMNTADRSIALVDHALRRRFAFLSLEPDYTLLRRYHEQRQTGFAVEGLIKVLTRLNKQIGDLHYAIGVSFFLRQDLNDEVEDIWSMEIEPYLEEYFFDQPAHVASFRWAEVKREILGS